MRTMLCLLATMIVAHPAGAAPKSYRLPSTDLKKPIIWGAVCDGPDGAGLAFGGQDQKSEDGRGHTRMRTKDGWQPIHEDLRKQNPLQKWHDLAESSARGNRRIAAAARSTYLAGVNSEKQRLDQKTTVAVIERLADELKKALPDLNPGDALRSRTALRILEEATSLFKKDARNLTVETVSTLARLAQTLERAAEVLDAEPPPRALSPLVYDAQTKLYFLFGGDHCDYLTNDTWAFDPAAKRWLLRAPKTAPPPRANHVLKAAGDGKIVLTGGYTYTSSTEYCGGQYRDHDDGEWTYDIAANTWTGSKPVEPGQRVYRSGPFLPERYLEGDRPDAAAFGDVLKKLPANVWTATKPPHRPPLNRDWGSAVLDLDHDRILRFSGGHSAHGGSDVIQYHLGSNRWELPFPVEFPLGQLYTNTEYPEGFNFNMRPWVTGHTYQNYGYDSASKKMLFTGETNHCYFFSPDHGDWEGRIAKPKGMNYGSCFYTLTLCATPHGLVCWTQNGQLFRFDSEKKEWLEVKLTGDKLPGSVVDNSTVAYDAKRDRLLFARKGYGDKTGFDGKLHVVDWKTKAVNTLTPSNKEAAVAVPYLCQLRYDVANDLLLVGGTLPPADGVRRTPAYDCAKDQWVSLRITGDDPSGKSGRNVSLGMMYDPKRKLFWAVDTNSNVFVLHLDPKTADMQPLR
jgi:hypothetical protein